MNINDLTTIANFKTWFNFQGTGQDDPLLASLITTASMDILAYLGRKSIVRKTFTEYIDGTGSDNLMMKQWPLLAVNSLTVNGTAQTAALPPLQGFYGDVWDGCLPGAPGYISLNGVSSLYPYGTDCGNSFPRGKRNIYVSYDAGYSVTDDATAIPAATPYTITAAQTLGRLAQDDGVENASTGAALTKVTSAPATGQYSVDTTTGIYTFAAADAGVSVEISYSVVPQTLERACWESVAERYQYRQHIGQRSHSVQGNTTVSFDNSGLTDFIKSMIQPYKMMVPF